MKKVLLGIISLFLIVGTVSAQDAKKDLRKAASALGTYNLDKSNNKEKLDEARTLIDGVMGDAEYGNTAKAYQTRAEIYNSYAEMDYTMMTLNPEHRPSQENLDYAMTAAESLYKALKVAEKKFETKDALTELRLSGDMLNAFANSFIQAGEYAMAYPALDEVTKINMAMDAQGETFLNPEDLPNHYYVTAYTAMSAEDNDRAMELFEMLMKEESVDAGVYASYGNLLMQSDRKDEGLAVLEKGRAAHPDNSEILFAEINYYITSNDYETLETKLSEAIEKEPDNPSLYSALGNVYMNLFTAAYGEGSDKATGYFDKSMQYYTKAVELDENQTDAVYSIGSLYFNKAVELGKKQAALGMSRDDQKKYEEYNTEISNLFDKALPYFQKSYAANAKDRNTLIALKEIYARKNDFEKSNKYKTELEAL